MHMHTYITSSNNGWTFLTRIEACLDLVGQNELTLKHSPWLYVSPEYVFIFTYGLLLLGTVWSTGVTGTKWIL